MDDSIRTVHIEKDEDGVIQSVRLVFGPHYFVELTATGGGLEFALGATHHGFRADASEIDGELERIIAEVRQNRPDSAID